MHMFIGPEASADLAAEGSGGGWLGFVVSRFLINLMEFWASFLIVIVAFAISLLFAIGQPLKNLYLRTKIALPKLPTLPDLKINNDFRDGADEDEDEDDESETGDRTARRRKPAPGNGEFIPQFVL